MVDGNIIKTTTDIIAVFATIITGGAIPIGKIAYDFFKVKKIKATAEAHSVLAKQAVKFAQDAFRDLNGEQRLDAAVDKMANTVIGHKLKITPDEIETAVREAYVDITGFILGNSTDAKTAEVVTETPKAEDIVAVEPVATEVIPVTETVNVVAAPVVTTAPTADEVLKKIATVISDFGVVGNTTASITTTIP